MILNPDLVSNRCDNQEKKFFKVLSASLPPDLYADLRDASKALRVSKSSILRCALDHFLKCKQGQAQG